MDRREIKIPLGKLKRQPGLSGFKKRAASAPHSDGLADVDNQL